MSVVYCPAIFKCQWRLSKGHDMHCPGVHVLKLMEGVAGVEGDIAETFLAFLNIHVFRVEIHQTRIQNV